MEAYAMPKINVYLSDELAEAVRAAGLSASPICQRALEQAVRRVTAVREVARQGLNGTDPTGRLARFTDRARTVLRFAVDQARADGAPNVGTSHLIGGLFAEGGNLALQVLGALEIDRAQLTEELARHAGDIEVDAAAELAQSGSSPSVPSPLAGAAASGELRFSAPVAEVLELAVTEGTSFGHTYVGCEHLLLGLIAEPRGAGGRALRALGAEQRLSRRAVAAALAGYAQFETNNPILSGMSDSSIEQTVRRELQALLQPLVERIERVEKRA
jgi:ATP-dependent Clp protease ATP-binding subunit ClpC